MNDLQVTHHFKLVEHPQANDQAWLENNILLKESRRKLDNFKGNWVKELPYVLWAYLTTLNSFIEEMPF